MVLANLGYFFNQLFFELICKYLLSLVSYSSFQTVAKEKDLASLLQNFWKSVYNWNTHRQTEPVRIHRLVKGPRELMFPKALEQGLLEVLQVISGPALSGRVPDGRLRRGGRTWRYGVWQGGALKVLIEQRGLADTLAGASVRVHDAAGQPHQRAIVESSRQTCTHLE